MTDKLMTEIQFLMAQRQAKLMDVDALERRLQALGARLEWRTAEVRKELKKLREERYGVGSR